MKLHDLRPAPGSHTRKTRVGRGIAAGKGKTAGRGTKGQKARAGGSIPPWFEGGQTPLHMRIPKLRGFENRFKIHYEVVNVGAIAAAAERGAFESGDLPGAPKGKKAAPLTVNQDVLRAVGLVRTMTKPLKILGAGELTVPLFVVADAFTKSATAKIEAAGGSVSVLETPTKPTEALGVDADARPAREARTAAGRRAAAQKADAHVAREEASAERTAEAAATEAARATKSRKAKAAKADLADDALATGKVGVVEAADDEPAAAAEVEATPEPETATEPEASDEPAADAGDAGDAEPTESAESHETAEADATDDENA
jgi:large subunit ribosomal protein L15